MDIPIKCLLNGLCYNLLKTFWKISNNLCSSSSITKNILSSTKNPRIPIEIYIFELRRNFLFNKLALKNDDSIQTKINELG